MSVVYIGDCSYTEVAGALLAVDPWGMDTLTRYIEGDVTQIGTYLATLRRRRDVQDTDYPDLYMVNYQVEHGRAVARATLNFEGIIGGISGLPNGALPEPTIETEARAQEVSLSMTWEIFGAQNDRITTLTYYAPSTTYRYLTKTKPLASQYKGKVYVDADSFQIASQSGYIGAINIVRGQSLAFIGGNPVSRGNQPKQNAYNLVAEAIRTQFRSEPSGQWWKNTEVNEARLIPMDVANARKYFNV